jgi:hypothetical protein
MGAYWRRLTSLERRVERLLRIIVDLKRQLRAAQQSQLSQRGN